MSKNLSGMDIGADYTRLYSIVGGKTEFFVEEPTILLYNEFGELKAFGTEAKEYLGKRLRSTIFRTRLTKAAYTNLSTRTCFSSDS